MFDQTVPVSPNNSAAITLNKDLKGVLMEIDKAAIGTID